MKLALCSLPLVILFSCNFLHSPTNKLDALMLESSRLNLEINLLKQESDSIYASILDVVPDARKSDALVVLGQNKNQMAISQDSWGEWDGVITFGASIMNLFQDPEILEELEELMREDMDALKAIKLRHDELVVHQDEVIVESLAIIQEHPDILGEDGNREFVQAVHTHYTVQSWNEKGGLKGVFLDAIVDEMFSPSVSDGSICPVCGHLPAHARISCLKCGGDGYLD
ncbi:hypothetical protein GGR28_003051 [Lewinella aquimaris]|uniref:Zinc ribbon domain-containing protein n=1 Tax=Neolewinella aquimaris TaxID=1835722 RepID=A0A840EAH0_9BACT|nr:hypothetical protein [Neolewinella aquimaris]MBB4080417.1 hypothetical protein [Neolewinella aquimaris]